MQVSYQWFDKDLDMAKHLEKFDILIAQHEAFWVERLTTLKLIALPYEKVKASHLKQKQYASVKVPVPHDLTTFLEQRHSSWNQGDFLEATFVAYLARIAGTGCFDIGFRVNLQQQFVGLEGFFASHVPCRVDIDFEQSFEEVFAAVRQQMELTKLHLTYHRDAIDRYLELRSLSHLGSEQMFPVVVERVEKLDVTQAGSGNQLTAIIPSDGKECCWIYHTEALDSDSIARMLDQFATFLQGIITNPAQPLAYLPLLSEQERHKILVEWNNTRSDYPLDQCIHQLFEDQVERTPDVVAVVFEDQELTYWELNTRANQLAHHLEKLGVGPEEVVGICMERSHQMIVGILGILKAGGAYLPLDPKAPQERLSYILEDAKSSVLLTQQELVNNFSEYEGHLVCLDTDWDAIATESENNPTSKVTINNLAYVMYTSGSTGEPKGVQVEHRSLGNLAAPARSQAWNVRPDSRILLFAPPHFSTSVPDIFMTLLVGATLYLAKQESLLPSAELLRLLRDQAITNAKFTPSVLAAMPSEELPALHTITVTGENCSAELVERWAAGRQFLNIYGATEASNCGTVAKYIDGRHKPAIGRPVANTQIYIMDSHLQPLPIGIPGELYIGGPGLARGYLNRPDLTAQKFIPNPFSNEPGGHLYKTGDLACYLPDGNIIHLGRIDNQIKIRGIRIELGEIETVLTQHSAVQVTVVTVREDIPGDKRLVAYVVLKQNQAATSDQLRRFLQQKLPDYMIPCVFVLLNALPLNANGKIDRRALPAPEQLRPDMSIPFVAPRTPIEQQIADIWVRVLNLERIGIHDNFFDLGGHSLLAAQVIFCLLQAFCVELRQHHLFQFPTVAELARYIETDSLAANLQNFPDDAIDGNIYSYEEGESEKIMAQLLADLDSLSVKLWVEGERLRYKAPLGVLTPEMLERLREYKAEIIQFLQKDKQNFNSAQPKVRPWSPLVGIQTVGSRPPFFCVHPLNGNILSFLELARKLGAKQPFYGLEAPGIDGRREPLTTIEDLAACYIKAISVVQPSGAYFLGGYSFGGMVAFEMAQQLQQQGHEVALLAIIDTLAPISHSHIAQSNNNANWIKLLFHIIKLEFGKKLPFVWEQFQKLQPQEQIDYLLEILKAANLISPDVGQEVIVRLLQVWMALCKAAMSYVPRVYPGQLNLFESSEEMPDDMKALPARVREYAMGWSELTTKPIEIYYIPGNHRTMLVEPQCRELADKLRSCLERAQMG